MSDTPLNGDKGVKSRKLIFTITGLAVHVVVFFVLTRGQVVDGGMYQTFVIGLGAMIAVYTGGNVVAKAIKK